MYSVASIITIMLCIIVLSNYSSEAMCTDLFLYAYSPQNMYIF